MGDLQSLSVIDHLMPLIGLEYGIWVKNLSLGICNEAVNVKTGAPRGSGGMKEFKPLFSFEKIKCKIVIVALDLISKIKDAMQF